MMNDELAHVIKNLVQQEVREIRPFVYAHISNYNAQNHTVRVVVPGIRDELTGAPLVSGWLPLGTLQTGSGVGVQVAPLGGASSSNPTAGEQCLVALTDRGTGVASVICMLYSGRQLPPSPSLPSPLLPGEMVAFSNGITVRWHSGGSLEITTTGSGGDINITASGKTNVVSTGDVTVNSSGMTTVTSTGDVNLASSSGSINMSAAVKVTLGGSGGKLIARDGDPVYNGTTLVGLVKASTTVSSST